MKHTKNFFTYLSKFHYSLKRENLSSKVQFHTHQTESNTALTIVQLSIRSEKCYATSNFDVGKIKVWLNLSLKSTAVIKEQQANFLPWQLQERVQHLLDILTLRHYCTCKLRIPNRRNNINPVIMLKKGETQKTV